MTFTPGVKGRPRHAVPRRPDRPPISAVLLAWPSAQRDRARDDRHVQQPAVEVLTHTFTAGRFAGTRISYLIGGSTTNIVDDYIWESGGKTFVLSVIVKRLGKTMNPWSKTAVIASFRAP